MKILLSLFILLGTARVEPLKEEQKINMLLDSIKNQKNAVFIRNGSEHSPQDAYDHLERKFRYGWFHGFSDGTASEFIDKIASESSSSGEKYRIRIKVKGRKKTMLLRNFLKNRLKKIEKKTSTRKAALR